MQLILSGRALQARVEADLAELGLTLRHVGALGHLSHRPDLSYSDLARRAGVTTPSMLATVRALEELGAVRRTIIGAGHPARLEVTSSGRKLLDRVKAVVDGVERELLGELTAAQRAALAQTLLTATKIKTEPR
ncbi:MarR family winged helix-turn-helix transcriptional regulator [Microlunatus speluncae]|uniref:MarR family winged helix-turn-helix transcriptional regulator n=1 Tax=Microlunatus speluncae TaxID=2594267 RepID=UPI001266452B|nr:MarR family transcriptional regulator [Microlunatus speluncae]